MCLTLTQKTINTLKTTEVHYESPKQKITITSLGASIKRYETIDQEGQFESIIMRYYDDTLYIDNPKFLGATIGPYAGRIYPAELKLNNKTYPLDKNFLNHANLHSGTSNIAFKNFEVEVLNETQVEFTLNSATDDLFPGPVHYKVLYTFNEDRLRIDYYSDSTVDTVINMTNHSYFNLSGDLKKGILDHHLTLPSDHYVELDDTYLGIKTNPVINTPFDFRQPKPLKEGIMPLVKTPTKGIDHPFYIDNTRPVRLHDPISKRELEVSTSYNAIVVYTNNLPKDILLNNHQPDLDHYAICLEAQYVPNDIYFEETPQSFVEANKTFHNFIEYKISIKL